MKRIADLDGAVAGFSINEETIDCLCSKSLIKINKHSGDIILVKTIFEKEGFSRKLIADEEQIFLYDFCILYVFNRKNFDLVGKWQLGQDLSSDICGIAVDNDKIYCSIRNGRIITIDRRLYSVKEYNIADNSMWSIQVYNDYLVCGTVDGKLLLLDKKTLSIQKMISLSRKNIGSVYIDGKTMYAASHDGKLLRINTVSLKTETVVTKAHKKMFNCVGIYKSLIMTVSYPGSEITLWNNETLEKVRVINYPLNLSGCAYIENDLLYIASRNINGIAVIDLSEQLV